MSAELELSLKQLLLKMSDIEAKMSDIQEHQLFNGQGELLCRQVTEIHKKVEELAETIKDPESGIIVKINRLEAWKEQTQPTIDQNTRQNVKLLLLEAWKANVTKIMWGVGFALMGLFFKALTDIMLKL